MLGFSIQKLLFTVAIVVAVWYGFKWLGRMKEIREQDAKSRLRRDGGGNAWGGSGRSERSSATAADTEEMLECPTCGAFVALSGVKSCGKDNCPY